MRGNRIGRAWRAGWVVLGLLWMAMAPAFGASADVARGLAWLQGQVQANGQLTTPSKQALPTQAQCETAQTLLRLAGNGAQVTSLVNALPSSGADTPTETLACWQFMRQQQGQSANAGLDSRRIDQGGFAAYEGLLAASPLDTGWAIAALSSVATAADKQGIHTWLQSVQQPDGAFKADARSNHYTTSIVLRGLKDEASKSTQALQIAQKAAAYLLGKKSPSGTWGNDTALTALVFEAVHPYSSQDATLAPAVEAYLLAQQQANGSWANDPYTTALALRAVALVPVTPQNPGQPVTTGTLQGTAKDANGQPLAGVSVAVVPSTGGPAKVATTDAQGNYAITGVPAGPVSISAAKDGYSQVSATGTIQAGGVLMFSPVLTPAVVITPPTTPPPAGTTTATVTGTVKDGAGQALARVTVTVTPVGGTAMTATTGAQGTYTIANVPAGTLTLSASKAGYATANASATLTAGATGLFSPTLKSSSDPSVTQVSITGKVVAADTQAPLAGVTVTVETSGGATATATTGADGRFSVRAAAGTLKLTYTKAGYSSVNQQATATGGSTVDAGTVQMPVARQTSSLHGVVRDTGGGAIAGATVTAAGKTATTNGAGAYVIPELSGTTITVTVSAAGFQTRSYELTIATPGDIVQDFILPSTSGDAYMDLRDLKVSPAAAGLNQDVAVTVLVSNPSQASARSDVVLEVPDPDGKVLSTLSGLDAAGLPIGTLNLAPGEQTLVKFQWNAASVPAGNYILMAKLVVPGSRSTANPTGAVTGSLRGQLTVNSSPHFSGAVTADPPVVQAGSNTPVKLSALVRNDGNVALAAAPYLLSVVDAKTGAVMSQTTANGAAVPLSALVPVDFGQWTPAASGSYRLEVTSAAAPGSKIVAPLYVGDMAKANFTVDKAVVPPGTQQVKSNIHVTGIDMASGTSVDPLAGVIRDAVVKAVNYGDNYAFNHYVGDLRCYACHVQTQAVVGGERNLRFAPPLDPLKRTALVNAITQNMRADGGVVYSGDTYIRVTTALGLWAAKDWHKAQDLKLSDRRMAEFLVRQASQQGVWTPDYGGHWWGTSGQLTGLNMTSLVDYALIAKKVGVGDNPTLGSTAIQGLPAGDMRLVSAPDSNIYVAHVGARAVYRIRPGEAKAELIVPNVPVVGIQYTKDGRLLLAATNGAYLSTLDGVITKLNASPVTGAIEDVSGGFLVRLAGTNKISRLDKSGNLTEFIQNSTLTTNGGSLQRDYDGSILAVVPSSNRVVRFNADGSFRDVPIAYANGVPKSLTPYQGGYLVGTSAGLFVYSDEWVTERWTFNDSGGAVALPTGIWVASSGQLSPLTLAPADSAALLSSLDTVIGRSTDSLVSGQVFNANDNLDLAFRLMGLAKAKTYYQGTARARTFDALMAQIGQTLWSRQKSDGGWSRSTSYSNSDPVATAIVGVGLDTLNPSKNDPKLRQAIQYVLNAQRGDGSWLSTNGLGGTLLSSTWIEIWLPTMLDRLGSIDADLRVTFGPDVVVANPEPPVTSTTTNADGTVEYVWKLTGVTGSGRDVDFDLTLKDMGEQEIRPVARQASLVFKNSFTSGEVVSPVVVPRVASNARMDIQVSTDKPIYLAEDTAVFTSPVTNGGVGARDAQVRFTVLDEADKTVAVLPLPALVSVDKGATTPVVASWSAAGVLAGPYQVLAELITADGTVYGSAKAPFAVKGGQGPANATRITTDKAQYTSSQPVQVQSVASNVSVNFLQEALTAETVVLDAQGREVLRKSETIVQLPPTARRQYVYGLAAGSLPPGVYTARLSLMGRQEYKSGVLAATRGTRKANPGDAVLSESVTSFQVIAAAVCTPGVVGNLLAQPSPVAPGQTVTLTLQLDNPAATAIQNATMRLRIVDADTGALIDEQSAAGVSVTASGQYKTTWSWEAAGTIGQNYLAVATLETAGCADVVAHASMALARVAPPGGGGGGGKNISAVPLNLHAPLLALLPLLAWGARRRRAKEQAQ